MKNTTFFILGIIAILSVSFRGSEKQITAPPSTNMYMAALKESPTYQASLSEALQSNCLAVLTAQQGGTTEEAIYKMKFAKAILSSTSSAEFKFVVSALTNTGNHTDIGNSGEGLDNCKTAFDANFDLYVKTYFGINF